MFTQIDFSTFFQQAPGIELSAEQYDRIQDCLPRQRGNVRVDNLRLRNALLPVVEQGCKWRGLPREFGPWHTISTRLNRWSKQGVVERVFVRLQEEQILAIRLEVLGLDSTSVKVHPDGAGARKKRPSSHRRIAWGLDDQDSSGGRVQALRPEAGAHGRPARRWPAGP